jgi:hypothetical protein
VLGIGCGGGWSSRDVEFPRPTLERIFTRASCGLVRISPLAALQFTANIIRVSISHRGYGYFRVTRSHAAPGADVHNVHGEFPRIRCDRYSVSRGSPQPRTMCACGADFNGCNGASVASLTGFRTRNTMRPAGPRKRLSHRLGGSQDVAESVGMAGAMGLAIIPCDGARLCTCIHMFVGVRIDAASRWSHCWGRFFVTLASSTVDFSACFHFHSLIRTAEDEGA